MAQHKNQLDQLLHRFLHRNANQEENALWWHWLWKLDLHEPDTAADTNRQERLWQAISQETLLAPPAQKRTYWRYLPAAAAIFLCGITLSWLLLQPRNTPIRYETISSDESHIKSVVLPDGTTVILNLSSSLTYPTDYNHTERRVTLKGEGYFKVAKNEERPFIVQSAGLATQVLGTAFNIEAREGTPQVRVALTAGKVVVHPVHRPYQQSLLEPGQLLRYEPASGQLSTEAFTNDVTSWTTGGLSFNGIPLSEALHRIAQHYHIRLQYKEAQLTGKTVTASMSRTSWQHALSGILFPHDLTYRIKDSLIIIQ